MTFAKDVAPILQKRCQECHRPGSIGPMSLRSYEEVRPWVRAIKRQRSRSGNAALPLRQDRNPASEERHAPERRGHPDDRALGGRRGAPRRCCRSSGACAVSRWLQVGVRGRVRSARSCRTDQAIHPSGQGSGSLVAADCARRHDGGPLHQGRLRQAITQGPRRSAPRQQRPDGPRRADRAVRPARTAFPSTRPARWARSCRQMAAGRFRPTR